MNAIELLVLDALLPEARKAAERQQRAKARQEEAAAEEWRQLQGEAEALVASLRRQASARMLTPAACDELRASLERYLDLLARIRAAGRSDAAWQDLRKSFARIEPVATRMLDLIAELAERRAVNSGWLSPQVGTFILAAVVLLPVVMPAGTLYLLLAAAAGIAAWRLLPNWFMIRQLRELAGKLG
jgi:hypothetical protein